MTKKQLWINIISFSILPIAIFSVTPYPSAEHNAITNIQNTTFWWIIQGMVLLAFLITSRSFFDIRNTRNLRVVQWYLLWNVFCFFRGMFVAEFYWDWKGLISNTMALMIPIVAYSATNKTLVKSMLSFYIKYTLPLFFLFFFIISMDAYGFYLVPISFILLFFPVLPQRLKIIVAIFTVLILFVDFYAGGTGGTGRSNVIKFAIPILLTFLYYLRKFTLVKWLEIARLIFIIAPMVFFALAASGVFNVLNMDNYIQGDFKTVKRDQEGKIVEFNLKADTRSFLYEEVLQTAKIYNFWWIGRSPARGNISESFGEGDLTGRGERLGNEVGVLNVFTWTGIVGLLLYLMVFYRASYVAIHFSNNIFSKMLGLLVAFRWLYSWVEDINNFSLNYFMLWIMIGVCFSKSFRDMSNDEVIYWVRDILKYDKKRPGKKVIQLNSSLSIQPDSKEEEF